MEEVFNGLKALETLKVRVKKTPEFEVQLESGHLETVTCLFQEPAHAKDLQDFTQQTGWVLPPDYQSFLERHNGVQLFTHPRNGGGMELLSTEKIILANSAYDVLPDFCYPVGYAHSSLICIDSNRIREGRQDYLFWQSCLTQYEHALYLNSNFSTWLDRYIITQGAEFWLWK